VDTKKAAVALGSRGGLARAKNLTPAQLSAIGKAGAKARWGTRPTHYTAPTRARRKV